MAIFTAVMATIAAISSCYIFIALILMDKEAAAKPIAQSTIYRKSSKKTKPRWNDEAKEYIAEQKELNSRPPL